MRGTLLFILLMGAFSWTACGDDVGALEDGTLLIGTASSSTGLGRFQAVTDGSDLTLYPGSQGGFHIYLHIRIDEASLNAMNGQPLLRRTARRVQNGDLASRATTRVSSLIPSDEAGFFELEQSIPLFLCPAPIGVPVADEPLLLEVEATSDDSIPGPRNTLEVTPRCPEGPQGEFCRRIC